MDSNSIIEKRLLDLEGEFQKQLSQLDKLSGKPGFSALEEKQKLASQFENEKHYWQEIKKHLELDAKLAGEPYWKIEKAYFC